MDREKAKKSVLTVFSLAFTVLGLYLLIIKGDITNGLLSLILAELEDIERKMD